MNTQTHVLLAVAAVVPLVQRSSLTPSSRRRIRLLVTAAVIGGLLPDASLFVMALTGMVQQVPTEIIFRQWYYDEFWQRLGAMTNSIPVFALISIVCVWMHRQNSNAVEAAIKQTSCSVAEFTFVLSTSSLLHTLTDLPLHHGDGHPHFWPFSNWIYASPVSYWDPHYHGHEWAIIETIIMAVLAVVLWRRYRSVLARSLTAITALSLLAISHMWTWVFS